MKIVVKKVGRPPQVKEIRGTLENIQELVGGYFECFPVFENVLCVCNEEGKLLGLPQNFRMYNDVIVGDVFFCAGVEEEFASLDESQINIIMNIFKTRM